MKSANGDGSSRVPSLLFYLVMIGFLIVAYWIHPLLALLPTTILVVYFCSRTIDKQISHQRRILDDALQRLEVQEAIAASDTEKIEEDSTIQKVEFPTNCPDCGHSLHVQNVTWIDSQTLICKNCGSTIKAIATHE